MKAVTLISGGLDSILAARVIKEEGIEVIPLHFKIPFCQRSKPGETGRDIASFVKKNLGVELRSVDISEEFLELVLRPRHGFGSNMNPCIDCKIFMLKKARELSDSWGAKFIVTGEILGQRPMSQHRRALQIIERDSGLEGFLLRPLCAKFLPATIPEKQGWVRRERLLDFSGRSRRPQIKLAREFNIQDYPNAAGGCLLTDVHFSGRLRDLILHESLSVDNIELLKIGRHFRLGPCAKLIVGRDETENRQLQALAREADYLFVPDEDLAGPASLGRGRFDNELVELSCRIMSRYCDSTDGNLSRIVYYKVGPKDSNPCVIEASPLREEEIGTLRL